MSGKNVSEGRSVRTPYLYLRALRPTHSRNVVEAMRWARPPGIHKFQNLISFDKYGQNGVFGEVPDTAIHEEKKCFNAIALKIYDRTLWKASAFIREVQRWGWTPPGRTGLRGNEGSAAPAQNFGVVGTRTAE